MSDMRLFLLGSPRLERDNVPLELGRRKAMALLAYLAVRDQPHRRDILATLFWPDYDHTSARADLRRMLSVLNKTLGKGMLVTDRESVRLNREADLWLDINHFHRLLANRETHGHPRDEVCPYCLSSLTEAVALYHDDFLTGFTLPDCPEFDEWQFFQSESLRQELASALERLVHGHSIQGEFEAAIPHARRWLALDPLHELAQRQLMQLYAWSGQSAAALRQYRECVRVLNEELGVSPEAATTELYTVIKAKRVPPPPSQTEKPQGADTPSSQPPASLHNLPPQLTPFIGREEELAKITGLIQDEPACHLLTLIGPGGIGKTRLSLQVAADSLDAFLYGVFFVSLAPISAAESTLPTIADALNLPLSGSNPKEQLLNYLSEKEMLLVLDNFEHLIPLGVTDLLSEMIISAPQIKLLVTSRERLNLQEEWGVEVSGLRFPVDMETGETSLETFESIRLFIQRAQRARPGFTLSDENSPHIVRICQLVEGMPLGLELAAAWVRMMSCQDIANEIEQSLDFLTTSLRDVAERHQSLRAVFEHSWETLSDEERAVFGKLSVFRGGFRRRAAERVAEGLLTHLSALVDKSLLRRTRAGRYNIHPLLHQYAAEKLSEIPDEVEPVQERHCNYYATFTQQRAADLKGRRQKEALDEITSDIDNIRAGWHWAITHRNVAALSKYQESLFEFYENRGWYQEADTAFEQAAERLREEDEKIVWAQLLRGQGWFRSRLGSKQGIELLEQSVSLLRQVERAPQRDLAFSALVLGWATHIWSEHARAHESLTESLAIYTQVNDQWGMGCTLVDLGYLAFYQGEYSVAEQYLQKSISALNQIGEMIALANALTGQGRIAQIKGEYEQAGRYLRRALRISREFERQFFITIVLRELGYLAIAQGSYLQAQEYLQESIAICKENGDRRSLVNSLDKMGTVTRLREEYEQAIQLHQECLTIAKEIDYQWNIALSFNNLGRLAYDQAEYRQAERYHRESLAIWKQLGNQREIASTLGDLGYAILALEQTRFTEARQQFRQALTIAAEIGARPVVLNVLVGWATLLSASQARDAELEQAAELLALALHHPASEQETKDKAKRLLSMLASSLLPGSMAEAQDRSKTKMLDTVVLEILEHNGLDWQNSG